MKDPAFLFYSNDFLSGTMLMTDEQVGKYIKLLCLQHQIGRLKEKDMLKICKTYDEDIFSKFIQDENGNFYNERLEEETIRRKKYSESRSKNRQSKSNKGKDDNVSSEDMKNICESYDKHMETETITETETININNNLQNKNEKKENEVTKIDMLMVECLNTTNISNIKECVDYLDKLPIDLIEYALRKTSRIDRPSWKYAMAILDSYVQNKFTNLEQVKSDELKHKGKIKTEIKKETVQEQVARYKKEWGLTDED